MRYSCRSRLGLSYWNPVASSISAYAYMGKAAQQDVGFRCDGFLAFAQHAGPIRVDPDFADFRDRLIGNAVCHIPRLGNVFERLEVAHHLNAYQQMA